MSRTCDYRCISSPEIIGATLSRVKTRRAMEETKARRSGSPRAATSGRWPMAIVCVCYG